MADYEYQYQEDENPQKSNLHSLIDDIQEILKKKGVSQSLLNDMLFLIHSSRQILADAMHGIPDAEEGHLRQQLTNLVAILNQRVYDSARSKYIEGSRAYKKYMIQAMQGSQSSQSSQAVERELASKKAPILAPYKESWKQQHRNLYGTDKTIKQVQELVGPRRVLAEKARRDEILSNQRVAFAETQKNKVQKVRLSKLAPLVTKHVANNFCKTEECENGVGTIKLRVPDQRGVVHCMCYNIYDLLEHIDTKGFIDPTYNTPFSKLQKIRIQDIIKKNNCYALGKKRRINLQHMGAVNQANFGVIRGEDNMGIDDSIIFSGPLHDTITRMITAGDYDYIVLELRNNDKLAYGLFSLDNRDAESDMAIIPEHIYNLLDAPDIVSIRPIQLPEVTSIEVTSLETITEDEVAIALENQTLLYQGKILLIGDIPAKITHLEPMCATRKPFGEVEIPLSIIVGVP